jgi:hypothetical protein
MKHIRPVRLSRTIYPLTSPMAWLSVVDPGLAVD